MAIAAAIPLLEAAVSAALPLITEALPLIKAAWNEAVSNDDFITKLKKEGALLVQGLAAYGSYMVPGISGDLAVVAGALNSASPDLIKFGQGTLNELQTNGKISFGAPLLVDGKLGPLTFAAVQALQTKLGLPVNGILGQIEQAALVLITNNIKLPAL